MLSASTVATPVIADGVDGQRSPIPERNWLVGAWQLGRGRELCDTLRVETDHDGNVTGVISSSWDTSRTRLTSWKMSSWPDPTSLVATFDDGRTVEYRAIPSPPGEWDFIAPDNPDVQRIDIAPEDPDLVVRQVRSGAGLQMRFHRVDKLCGVQ